MGIYQGLLELKTAGCIIMYYYSASEKEYGSIRLLSWQKGFWQMYINVAQPSDEQVKTFIHETLHVSPEFRAHMKQKTTGTIEPIIDELTENVFREQPLLVERIRRTIVIPALREHMKKEQEEYDTLAQKMPGSAPRRVVQLSKGRA